MRCWISSIGTGVSDRLQRRGNDVLGAEVDGSADNRPVDLTLPRVNHRHDWRLVLDTSQPDIAVTGPAPIDPGRYQAKPRSVVILEHATDTSSSPAPPY